MNVQTKNQIFQKQEMKKAKKSIITLLLIAICIGISVSIQIPLHQSTRCMMITATFQYQPIKVQIQFPAIPHKLQGERYQVSLYKFTTGQLIATQYVEDDFVFRKNYKLQTDVLYHLCMQVIKVREYFQPQEEIYVNYMATEDFDTLIGKIEIPPELSGEENLLNIYKVAKELTNLNKAILENQKKERELEDQLVTDNIHKNQRIYTLTLIECLVIVLSGVYQVFALRRFLIEKNLY